MLIKPNEQTFRSLSSNDFENDLYRQFRPIFAEILHPDDTSYNVELYIQTENGVEEIIKNIFNNFSDGIIPILGYTGMGKTFLMHYCIKENYNYNEDNVIKNRSFIVSGEENDSIIIYSSYDASCEEGEFKERLAGKFSSASEIIINRLQLPNSTTEDKLEISKCVANYIKENKPELLELYADSPENTDIEKARLLFNKNKLAYEAERLKWVMTNYQTNIENIILVLDDIEGLLDDKEYVIINTYLTMYDCLRRYNRNHSIYNVKLFICMRERTYNEIKKMPWYDTHRTAAPISLYSGIQLHEIFMRRFDHIVKERKILDDVEKKERWNEAKDVLVELSQHLDKILSNDILQLCNYNVCKAVQLFTNILSNRQWTQRNERVQDGFRIDKYQFFLSAASCYKVIAMRNATIYTNSYELSNLFYDNDNVGYCLPLHILLMLKITPNGYRELTLEKIQENIISILKLDGDKKIKKEKQIEEIIAYFFEEDILFEKVTKPNDKTIIKKYYIAPKGQVLLRQLFENTVLLEIYRDDIYLDDKIHDTRCSYSMSREELFKDTIKIIEDIAQEEEEFWNSSVHMNTQKIYFKLWGNDRICIRLIIAMKKSLYNYYKQEIPNELSKKINQVEKKYREIFENKE